MRNEGVIVKGLTEACPYLILQKYILLSNIMLSDDFLISHSYSIEIGAS